MITYLDSSVIVRAYLPDEPDHDFVRTLLESADDAVITGSLSRLEVTGALVRAARANRGDESRLLDRFAADVHPVHGGLAIVDAHPAEIELVALSIVRRFGIRAMDAWHLACASLAFDDLAEPGEQRLFATRDERQAEAARDLGFGIL